MEVHTHFLVHRITADGQLHDLNKTFTVEYTPLCTLRNAAAINSCIVNTVGYDKEYSDVSLKDIDIMISSAERALSYLHRHRINSEEYRWELSDWTIFKDTLSLAKDILNTFTPSKYNALLIIRKEY